MSNLLKPERNFSDYGTKESNYVIEIDLGSDEQNEENIENEELAEEELVEEEEMIAADVREEKRPLFVDTSGRAVDEETQAETDKIGEKGSVARDMYSGEENINDKPRLESETDFPGEVPEELATAVSQESGLPIDVSLNEPVKDVDKEAVENLVEEETTAGLPEADNSEELPVNDEVEELDTTADESLVQDVSAADDEEMSSQTQSQDTEPVESVEAIDSTVSESDVVILESESRESDDVKTDVVEDEIEKTTDPVEEYTKTASIPKALMKEIVDGMGENVANKVQNKYKPSEPQLNNVPAGDGDPFFKANISNASMTGAESFNVKKHEYAPYYKHIKDKIRLYWLLQYGTDASISQVTKGYKPIVVTFKVLPSGKIMNVAIADSAGNELLASKIRISIKNTILNKFPDYINEKYIDVKFSYFFF
ncbi:MAG: hypothetical protein ACYSR1_05005 [Planctomycetota bacterium]